MVIVLVVLVAQLMCLNKAEDFKGLDVVTTTTGQLFIQCVNCIFIFQSENFISIALFIRDPEARQLLYCVQYYEIHKCILFNTVYHRYVMHIWLSKQFKIKVLNKGFYLNQILFIAVTFSLGGNFVHFLAALSSDNLEGLLKNLQISIWILIILLATMFCLSAVKTLVPFNILMYCITGKFNHCNKSILQN